MKTQKESHVSLFYIFLKVVGMYQEACNKISEKKSQTYDKNQCMSEEKGIFIILQ
jgi:hypothetical protein